MGLKILTTPFELLKSDTLLKKKGLLKFMCLISHAPLKVEKL